MFLCSRGWRPLRLVTISRQPPTLLTPVWRLASEVGQLVGQLNCHWPSPAVILGFSLLKIQYQDFYSLLDMHMFWNRASSLLKEESVFLCRFCVCCIAVSAWVYSHCHGIQVLQLAVHCQTVRLGAKPLEACCSRVPLSVLGRDCIENTASYSSSTVACIRCLVMALALFRVHTAMASNGSSSDSHFLLWGLISQCY
jgi:hypothetical protein